MPKRIHVFALLCALLASCGAQDSSVSTYTVERGDFENVLVIDGYTEPVNSITITYPMGPDATVIYLVEDGTWVEEGELLCKLESTSLESAYDEMMTAVEEYKTSLAVARANLEMQYALLEAQVRSNHADTEIARMDSLQLEYLSPTQRKISELELERVAINQKRYDQKIETLKQIQRYEITEQELKIRLIDNQIEDVQKYFDNLEHRAPRAGLALRPVYSGGQDGAKLQVGDLVLGSMPLVMLPDMSVMKVKIMAPERDYKLINVNDSVVYAFDALPGKFASGKITKKAPVGSPYKRGSKVKYFEIEASVDSVEVIPEPGFTAMCNIMLKHIPDTLFIPHISLFEQDSMKFVYVKQNRGFEMREVKTGTSSTKMAIITEGLHGGEEIALRQPKDSQIKKRVLLAREEKEERDKEEGAKNDSTSKRQGEAPGAKKSEGRPEQKQGATPANNNE